MSGARRGRRGLPVVTLAVAGAALAQLGASGIDATLWAVLALVLVAGKLFGAGFERLGLPSVLGELSAGIALGNLHHLGLGDGLSLLATDPQLAILAELGVLVLLFQVGLESNLGQMAKVGGSALLVACVGVVLPMALGWGVHAAFEPARSWHTHLFVGAVLAATSVGITARVFKDLGKIASPTGRVVLGAAVIDDVLGLVVLAVVSGIVVGAETGRGLDPLSIALLIGKAAAFLGAAVVLGPWASRRLYRAASRLRVRHVLLAASLAFCFVVSWLAHLVQLAPIIGAFAAGLVLDELTFQDLKDREPHGLEEQIHPIGEFLVPMFFVITGAKVDLAALANPSALALAGGLTLAALVGKQACSLVAYGPGVHRLSVGLGMIPRGEVGLIFAAAGHALLLGGQPVISSDEYAAVVLMVMITTMVTPPLLAWSLRRAPDAAG